MDVETRFIASHFIASHFFGQKVQEGTCVGGGIHPFLFVVPPFYLRRRSFFVKLPTPIPSSLRLSGWGAPPAYLHRSAKKLEVRSFGGAHPHLKVVLATVSKEIWNTDLTDILRFYILNNQCNKKYISPLTGENLFYLCHLCTYGSLIFCHLKTEKSTAKQISSTRYRSIAGAAPLSRNP